MVEKTQSQASPEELMRLGIKNAKQGNRDAARMLFNQVLEYLPRDIGALMWLASIARSEKERRQYLRAVLKIDPTYERAKQEILKLNAKREKEEQRSVGFGLKVLGVLLVILIVGVATALIISRML